MTTDNDVDWSSQRKDATLTGAAELLLSGNLDSPPPMETVEGPLMIGEGTVIPLPPPGRPPERPPRAVSLADDDEEGIVSMGLNRRDSIDSMSGEVGGMDLS